MILDDYLAKEHRGVDYNCLHFAREAWRDLTGEDLPATELRITKKVVKSFKRLDNPVDPCVVLMRRKFATPHIGIYYRGKVLHLRESGAEFFPLPVATLGFTTVRFYLPC